MSSDWNPGSVSQYGFASDLKTPEQHAPWASQLLAPYRGNVPAAQYQNFARHNEGNPCHHGNMGRCAECKEVPRDSRGGRADYSRCRGICSDLRRLDFPMDLDGEATYVRLAQLDDRFRCKRSVRPGKLLCDQHQADYSKKLKNKSEAAFQLLDRLSGKYTKRVILDDILKYKAKISLIFFSELGLCTLEPVQWRQYVGMLNWEQMMGLGRLQLDPAFFVRLLFRVSTAMVEMNPFNRLPILKNPMTPQQLANVQGFVRDQGRPFPERFFSHVLASINEAWLAFLQKNGASFGTGNVEDVIRLLPDDLRQIFSRIKVQQIPRSLQQC